MALKKHDWVKVVSLKREGQIMEVLRSGTFKVAVSGLVILCRASDLLFLPKGPPPATESRSEKKRKYAKAKGVSPANTSSLDLHGMLVEEALRLVESRVNQSILSGADGLRIVHGKGAGKIKAALHRYLGGLGVVKRYKLDESNPGVTWVYF